MKASVADFHVLDSRIRLRGTLTTVTGLRIGSGGSGPDDAANLPVLRDADGFPLIPGSSLKGALRSTIEGLVRAVEPRNPQPDDIWACDPLSDGKSGTSAGCGYHEEGQRSAIDPEIHCTICRLLGSHVVASHVRFGDALEAHDRSKPGQRIPIEVRDGVAIDRDLRTAADDRKYDFEVVSPGTQFGLEIFVENPKPWLLGLLMLGFDQIGDGFTALGGFTSRGLGRVRIDWQEALTVTAKGLLTNQPKVPVTDSIALKALFASWRDALTVQVKD